ncbi:MULTISPECIES: type I glyceraldehyde-3-phosphate dehydrogenase [Azospira]|uniref:Glyceraldehyde 3-phosphate dehydrogenase/D-erythrose 4-phosphate dehydrogenase n=1 Tax=Azospira oryzae TaxID=146939 RepID=A0ABY0IQ29_9RHOO|nr:glyceraldehyde 3-phosphate dehydrogenase NAD-binding domain-containing protein [Azospira oryzae]RZT75789.1 glyceraldehyde 3-phosphate dehydrogenase/D-erythrose 4-phosphate dehydrogenase [Azospira oryzae]
MSGSLPPLRLAINGYGRIGRCFLRALHERGLAERFQVVAINEPANSESIAYLTRFDSTHGRFPAPVELQDGTLVIDGRSIQLTHADTPEGVDWRSLKVDLLVECSGQYSNRAGLRRFLEAGCPRVLLSHPANSAADVDATVVYGLNHGRLNGDERIVSNASCTTNAVVPVLELLDRELGLEQVLLTTLHSVMNDQPLVDGYHHSDLRRTRSAMQSMIPVSTGLARGVERLLPGLKGKVLAKAIRVPTLNVSAIDLTVTLAQDADVAGLNALLQIASNGPWKGVLTTSAAPHASIDFNHDPHSAIVDLSQTRAGGARLFNLFIWFDNEWGFVNRMVDVAQRWHAGWSQS